MLNALLASATPVHGAWGSGRLLRTSLVSVLMTDQGRTFVGAVQPSVLYAAAARARPQGHGTLTAISTSGLTKRFRGGQLAVDHIDLAVPARLGLRLPRPERVGQDHHDQDAARPGLPDQRASATLLDVPMPDGATRVLHRVGSLVEGPAFYPFLTGPTTWPGTTRRTGPPTRARRGPGSRRPWTGWACWPRRRSGTATTPSA